MLKNKTISPYKTTLDAGNAYWMARLSKAVYLKKSETDQTPDEDKILANLKEDDDGFLSVSGFDNKSSQAALIEHQEYLCMSFRGTDESADWLDNINVLSKQKSFGKFHKGFWNALEDIWKPLDDQFHSLQKQKERPLFITGHSLGGAMASIAAARIISEDRYFISVYTFGQPRALTRTTAKTFDAECRSRFFRFHNNNDIVTRIPSWVTGYSHVGTHLYITEENEIHSDKGFWFRFIDYIDGAFSSLTERGVDAIFDHNIDEYLTAIEKWDLK